MQCLLDTKCYFSALAKREQNFGNVAKSAIFKNSVY